MVLAQGILQSAVHLWPDRSMWTTDHQSGMDQECLQVFLLCALSLAVEILRGSQFQFSNQSRFIKLVVDSGISCFSSVVIITQVMWLICTHLI